MMVSLTNPRGLLASFVTCIIHRNHHLSQFSCKITYKRACYGESMAKSYHKNSEDRGRMMVFTTLWDFNGSMHHILYRNTSLNGHIVVWPTVPHFNQLDKSTFCFTSNMVILWKKT